METDNQTAVECDNEECVEGDVCAECFEEESVEDVVRSFIEFTRREREKEKGTER